MAGEELRTADDEALVDQFRRTGNSACFAELFRRHARGIYGACYAVVQNAAAAEDLAQEAFVTALTKIHLYREGNFGGWLATIARRACLNYLRAKPARDTVAAIVAEEEFTAPGFGAGAETADAVRSVLEQLSDCQRVCLKLLYMHGYSYKEAAELMRLPETDIKSHAQNGRRRFIVLWEKRRAGGES